MQCHKWERRRARAVLLMTCSSSQEGNLVASKLIWGILGGVVLGTAFGQIASNTPMGIAICMAAGVIAAGVWHYLETRNRAG